MCEKCEIPKWFCIYFTQFLPYRMMVLVSSQSSNPVIRLHLFVNNYYQKAQHNNAKGTSRVLPKGLSHLEKTYSCHSSSLN